MANTDVDNIMAKYWNTDFVNKQLTTIRTTDKPEDAKEAIAESHSPRTDITMSKIANAIEQSPSNIHWILLQIINKNEEITTKKIMSISSYISNNATRNKNRDKMLQKTKHQLSEYNTDVANMKAAFQQEINDLKAELHAKTLQLNTKLVKSNSGTNIYDVMIWVIVLCIAFCLKKWA
jgi:hypothetical protein